MKRAVKWTSTASTVNQDVDQAEKGRLKKAGRRPPGEKKGRSTSTSRKVQWSTSTSWKRQVEKGRLTSTSRKVQDGRWSTSTAAFFSVHSRQPFSSRPSMRANGKTSLAVRVTDCAKSNLVDFSWSIFKGPVTMECYVTPWPLKRGSRNLWHFVEPSFAFELPSLSIICRCVLLFVLLERECVKNNSLNSYFFGPL